MGSACFERECERDLVTCRKRKTEFWISDSQMVVADMCGTTSKKRAEYSENRILILFSLSFTLSYFLYFNLAHSLPRCLSVSFQHYLSFVTLIEVSHSIFLFLCPSFFLFFYLVLMIVQIVSCFNDRIY